MTEPERPTLAELRTIDLFDEISDEEVERWRGGVRCSARRRR